MSLSLKLLFLLVFVACMIIMGSNLRKKKKKIIFLGDSITELGVRPGGYVTVVSDFVRDADASEKVELVGSGISGNKVTDIERRLAQDVLLREPQVVVLFVGVNDIWHKQKHGTGTSLDLFVQCFESIVQKMHNANIKVVACTPAVIGENGMENKEEWDELEAYGKGIKDVSAHYDIPVVDLHAAFKNYYEINNTGHLDEGVLTTDGVHLNAAGNRLVAEEIWKVLKHFI